MCRAEADVPRGQFGSYPHASNVQRPDRRRGSCLRIGQRPVLLLGG